MFKSKNKIFVIALLITSVSIIKVANAGIVDNILKTIGINNDTKEDSAQIADSHIDKEVEEYLDSKQREVAYKIDEIYNNIQNVDIEALIESIDYKFSNKVIGNVKEYFDEYEGGLENVKVIMSTLNYKIIKMTNAGDTVTAKITYTYPSASKIIKKVIPSIIIKNPSLLIGGEITNDVLDSILDTVKNELKKGAYEVETSTRDFSFKKVSGEWKVVDVDSVVKDATKYINGIGGSILK